MPGLADGYTLRDGPPPPEVACALRERSGLSPKTLEQCRLAMAGSWAAAHVVEDASGEPVGMGRVIGDGGWYFHIADMAVFPEHQRRGIGDAILARLVALIDAAAPLDAFITLLADPPGRRLYARHGFVETAPHSIGMALGNSSTDRNLHRFNAERWQRCKFRASGARGRGGRWR